MRSSQILIDHIKRFECGGKPILEAIWDAHGKVWMIGYGHSPGDVKKGDKITAQQAEDLLKKDMEKFERYASVVRGIKTQGQFDAVVDFMYNCGVANFNKSTLKKYIEGGFGGGYRTYRQGNDRKHCAVDREKGRRAECTST